MATGSRAPKSSVKMCVVTIDYREYLLPLSKGLALIDLMQHATKCDSQFGISAKKMIYTDATPAQIEMEIVAADQLKPKSEKPNEEEF